MDAILQSILDVAGVSAVMVFDAAGRLVAHRGHAIYDRSLCEQLGGLLVKAIDTIQLQQDDWDSISAQYGDGKLLLRKLACAGGNNHTLAIVADANLNASFATVAIRVASNKLRRVLEGGAASSMLGSAPQPMAQQPHAASQSVIPVHVAPPVVASPGDSRPVLSQSGLSWSKAPASASGTGSGSSIGLSRISVADPASAAFLTRCVKELARHVGPMAKVYIEEAVRRVSPDAPFSLASAAKLGEDLAGQIEDADDREQFRKALAKG